MSDEAVAPTRDGSPARSPRDKAGFRPDIDGLRALAIVLVVAFHAHLPGFDGGFVGVDVFFAISGYLITGILLRDAGGGAISLRGFWAKRIRRLVPSLALVVVASVIASYLILSPLAMAQMVRDARAALLYVSNIAYAREANDYFANDLRPSVLLNTWSLGVEEQFYLLWPVAFALIGLITRARPSARRRALLGLLGLATAGSLWWSIHLTAAAPANAFFLLPSRIWEFGAAGLLAALGSKVRLSPPAATVLGSVGLLAIVGSAVGFDSTTPYPGGWALVPVGATLAVIVSGGVAGRANPLSRGLAWSPFQAIGRVSYSWYLWHWPVIVLAVEAVGSDGVGVRVIAALGALALAAGTHVTVEDRVRFSARLARSRRLTYGGAAALTTACLALTVVIGALAQADVERGPLAGLADVRDHRRDFVCPKERISPTGVEYCEDGDPAGAATVLLVGDSHARHWKPAFAEAAKAEGVRLLIRWRPACPSVPVTTARLDGGGTDDECNAFRADTARLLDEVPVDAVVVANSHLYSPLVIDPHPDGVDALWEQRYREQVEALNATGTRSGLVVDTPRLPFDPVDCLATEGEGDECRLGRAEAFEPKAALMAAERQVADDAGVPTLDITDTLCGSDVCPLVIDHTYVYADNDHLTEAFVLQQVPEVRLFLREVLGRTRGR